jgi:arginine/lysine/histidine/glutamine transport system substrate-binding and permease protein
VRPRNTPPLLVAALLLGTMSAVSASALDDIRARGKLIIATDATYPPFEFVDKEVLQGFDIDLGNEIGKELHLKVQWSPMAWSGVLAAPETRKADLIMSGMTITEERKKGYGFSRPYFLSGQVIARRRGDAGLRGPRDLRGKTVAVQQETTGQKAAEKLGLPADHIKKFETLQDALVDVINKRSDAAIGDLPALQWLISKSYPNLEIAGDVFVHENVGIATRHGETVLIAALNAALDRIMVDGRYTRIYEHWIGAAVTTASLAALDRVSDQGTPVPKLAQIPKTNTGTGGTPPPGSGVGVTIHWELLGSVLPPLLRGARMTLFLTALVLLLGVPAGLLVALARLSGFRPLTVAATIYVEAVRGTPLLMQIYVIYFVLPACGINLPQLTTAITALSLNAAAYISEIFRAGIQSIDAGQTEAAQALGMSRASAMRWVILPQTLRRVLPPLTNEAVALLKDSSLVSIIALTELMRVGTQIAANTGAATTIYLAVAFIYLAMTLPLTHLVRYLEAKWQPVSTGRRTARRATEMVGT